MVNNMDDLIEAYRKLGYTNAREVHTDEGTGYYITNRTGNGAVYLPPNATEADAVVSMMPGISNYQEAQAGIYQYDDYIRNNILEGDVPPNTIVVVNNTTWDSNCTPNAVNAAINSGLDIQNVGIMTFSGSGQTGMRSAATISTNYPEIEVRVAHCDAYMTDYEQSINVNSATSRANIENGVTVLSILPVQGTAGYENEGDMLKATQTMAESGHISYMITSSATDHGTFRVEFLNSGGLDWLVGKGDLEGKTYVKVEKYDQETGQWVDSDINELERSGYVQINGEYIEIKSKKGDAEALRSELIEKDEGLSTFAKVYKSDGSRTLASDLSFVSNSVDEIRTQISARDGSDLSYTVSKGQAGVLGSAYDLSNYYKGINSALYTDLSAEADAVYTIADSIYRMDGAASLVAETTLSDGVSELFSTTNFTNNAQQLRELSAKLVSDARAATDMSKYNNLTNFLGSNLQYGNVGSLSKSDLNAAINSIVPQLEAETATAQGLKNSLETFRNGIGSNILQGGIWDNVGKNLDTFGSLLDANMETSNFIQDVLKAALIMVEEAMTEDEMSDEKYDELREESRRLGIKIAALDYELERLVASKHMVTDYDHLGNAIGSHQEPPQSLIDSVQTSLDEARDNKEKVDTEISNIEQYVDAVIKAQSLIDEALSQVKATYEDPAMDIDSNAEFSAKYDLNLESLGIDGELSDYVKRFDDYYQSIQPQSTSDLETPADTQQPAGNTQQPGVNPSPSSGNPGSGNPSSGGDGGGGNPSTDDSAARKKAEEEAKKKAEEEAKKKAEEEAAKQKAEAEAQRKAAEEEAKKGDSSKKDSGTTSSDADRKAAEEAARKAAEEAARKSSTTPSRDSTSSVAEDGSTVTRTSSTPTGSTTYSGGGVNTRPSYTQRSPYTGGDEIIDSGDLIIEPTMENATVSDYYETQIPNAPIIEEPVTIDEVSSAQPKNKGVKTMGIAAGIGLAVGASALGAHALMKSKEDEEEDFEDYDD